ncbi:hypothetical protein ACH5RR_039298 [Cinchona calisaya]|uniref:Uncharacterized protein n=1 Tax=Cinchona calisaya TaxID=153742 RepID=A0ABD2Y1X4_9GENT
MTRLVTALFDWIEEAVVAIESEGTAHSQWQEKDISRMACSQRCYISDVLTPIIRSSYDEPSSVVERCIDRWIEVSGGMPAVSVVPPLVVVSTAFSFVFPSECELFNQSVAESEIGESKILTLRKSKSTLCLLDCQHQDERLPQSKPRRRNLCLVLNAPFFPSKEVEPILNYLERMDRPNQPTRSSLVCLLSAVKPMVRIGRIGDLQLGIYTNNLKNNDWKHSIHHGVWSFSSHSPVTSLRLAVPHRLGDIESDRLHKLIHPEEDVNRLFTLQKGRKEIS